MIAKGPASRKAAPGVEPMLGRPCCPGLQFQLCETFVRCDLFGMRDQPICGALSSRLRDDEEFLEFREVSVQE